MKDEKILVTGANSTIGEALARSLCGDNEVWGLARFGDPDKRKALEDAGIRTHSMDLGSGDFTGLPDNFTRVLHLAYFRGPRPEDIPEAMRVNVEGTGLLFGHCRKAKSILYMSSHVIYNFYEDPWHKAREDEPFGGAPPSFSATATISKVSGEGVSRYCARQFNVPVVIARLNSPYGNASGCLPTGNMDAVVAGGDVYARWDPEPYSPIHLDDMCDQVEAMLDAASVSANIVNWCGDEPVTVQHWTRLAGELAGREPSIIVREAPGSKRGSVADSTKRRSITGPCKVDFDDAFRRIFAERHGSAGKAGDA
ncbi:MAG: NAD(P)-dependent oxidoreductase [Novosphingobium sp.]|nr:NAD(P)-dependent oxidoreductase [Novosphingobium sp.]